MYFEKGFLNSIEDKDPDVGPRKNDLNTPSPRYPASEKNRLKC